MLSFLSRLFCQYKIASKAVNEIDMFVELNQIVGKTID